MHYVNVPVGMSVFDYANSSCLNNALCVINSIHNFTRTDDTYSSFIWNLTLALR